MFFFGGGQQEAHWDALRLIGEWCSKRVLRLNLSDGEAWGKKLVLEVARRNAKMVAAWQAYGFMHGVINTDKYVLCRALLHERITYGWCSVSVLGLTIDYGESSFPLSVMTSFANASHRTICFHGCLRPFAHLQSHRRIRKVCIQGTYFLV
jgi:uncharacterized protein YdiU (UPF0061 family)